MSNFRLLAVLAAAALACAAQAQQQVMPPAGALKPIEPAKVARPPVATARVAADRLALVGREDDLYRGLNLTPAQSAQLKANLGQLRCLPPGAAIPGGHVMMQVMPTGGALGTPGGSACMNDSIDAAQLASLRSFLRAELKRRNADLAQFDNGIPKDCAFGEMQYYLAIVAQF